MYDRYHSHWFDFNWKSPDIINLSGEELVGYIVDIKHVKLHHGCRIISYNKGKKHRHYQIKNKSGRIFEKSYRHLINIRKK